MNTGSCIKRTCFLLPLIIVCLLNVVLFSIRWKKQYRVQWIYFGFCFLTVFGSVLLVGAGCFQKALKLGSDFYVNGLIILSFLLIFVLCSFATVCTTIWYLFIITDCLYWSVTFSVTLWPQLNANNQTSSTNDTNQTNFCEDYKMVVHAYLIKSLIITSHFCIVCGCLVNMALSITNHWRIYKVGSSTRVCCITRCCCGCYNCCLCCEDREIRLKFNNVTLYHQTLADSADKILQSQTFKPGTGGMAGGGIYFASKPPSTEGKARVGRRDEKKMLKATVRLGKILKVDRGGIEGCLPGLSQQSKCDEVKNYLDDEKYDSIWIPLERPEFVVYQPDQVVDVREVNY